MKVTLKSVAEQMFSNTEAQISDLASAAAAVVVGYEAELLPGAQEGLQLDDFGAETEKTNAKRRVKFLETMHEAKLLGQIKRIVAADIVARELLDTADLQYGVGEDQFISPAQAFAKWILSRHAEHIRVTPYGYNQVVFYGLDVKPMFSMLGPLCSVDADYPIPLGLWYGVNVLDPYEMLVESDCRLQIPLSKVFARGKLRLVDGYVLHKDADADCRLAIELCSRFSLFPFPVKIS